MKRWRWVSGLLVLAAIAWWWFRPAADGPRTSSGEAETVASSAAPGDGARLLNALQNAPLPPSEGELSIEGRVLDPAGEPVPDATVIATAGAGEDVLSAMRCHCDDECGRMLLECACPQSAVQLAEMVAERRGEAPPLARVRTDGEGRFSLTGLGEGRYAVWAEHGKRGIAVVARVGAGTQGITVHLQPGIALTGSTVDRDHHPVPGAVVTAVYVQNSRFFDAVTSEKGGFRLAPLPAGRYSVVVSADGYLPEHRSVGDDDSEPLSFTLSRPRAISGRVQRDGAPVAQARVEFYGAHRRLEVTTDAAGRFQATGLRAGEYSIQATQGGEIGATSVSLTPEADATGVEVALGPGGSVVGQVVDETGAPVVAEVRASRRYEYAAAPIRTKTDPQGHFSFSALLPGSYRISASAERFQRLEEAPTAETSRPAGPPVQITLKRGARVAGRVRDPDGKPIEGASVEVAGVPSRTTATDGTFAIEGAEPGTLKVTASHSGYLTTEQAVTAPSEAIELVLARGGRLTGKVLDENGAPVADAQVIATEQTQEAASQQAKTKADGTFLLEGLEDGSFEVSARTGDAENTREVHAQVELSGGAAAPLTLRFDPGFPLEGQVVDPAGRPIVGADVLISREGSSPIEVTIHPDLRARRELKSGADGHFRARYLPNLPLQVMAMKEGFGGGGLVKAKAGQADLRLVLEPLPRVTGVLTDASGRPIPDFTVDGRPVHAADGRFDTPRWPSRTSVSLQAHGFAPVEVPLGSDSRANADLGVIHLEAGRTVEGAVVDVSGQPVSGARVYADFEKGGNAAAEPVLGGGLAVRHVPPGWAKLTASAEGFVTTTQTVAAGESQFRMVLSSGGTVTGHVSGLPPGAAAYVFATAESHSGASGRVKADGSYTISALATGHYALHLAFPEAGRSRVRTFVPREVDVAEGASTVADFDSGAGVTVHLTELRGHAQVMVLPGAQPLPADAEAFGQLARRGVGMGGTMGGSLELGPLPPGDYTIVLLRQGEGLRLQTSSLVIHVGEADLSVSAASAVEGPLYDISRLERE